MTEEEIIKICKDLISMTDYKFQCNYTTKERNQATQDLLDLYNKQKEEIEELKKYDYRNIKIDDNNKIYSIHVTKEQLHWINFGIALYVTMQNFDKLNDKNDI